MAQEETRRLQHSAIGPVHLLLGLLHVQPRLIGRGLGRVMAALRDSQPRGEEGSPQGLPCESTATAALEEATVTADQLGHHLVTPGLLLLGLLDQPGVAELLADCGVDVMSAREEARVDAEASSQPAPVGQAIQDGSPVPVRLGYGLPIGDLGNPRTDARLLSAIMLRGGAVADWLRVRGLEAKDVEDAFPGSAW